MSTFGGVLPEFPHIRVDYFRHIPGAQNPLAAFLSHVHSDHLNGLENLKAPFIYCSDTTKQLLLRLERKFHHVNYELGILESHKQQYKHLKSLLKPIPLSIPTRIELAPGNEIQVTLLDANHCPGAVMFLFESDSCAVLYTGDVRAEPWFVNTLIRNPFLIEYTTGQKSLDCIYLDTSFTDQNMTFPTKAQGLSELLAKVAKYPLDTVFHFSAWTFGYEEVWMALSKALKSHIHVNKYKLRLFQSLDPTSREGPFLSGYQCGNANKAGILTQDQHVRLHSCEKGTGCTGLRSNTVWIKPIITRTAFGYEINEIGVGGGGGDLTERSELQIGSDAALQQLLELLVNADDSTLLEVRGLLRTAFRTSQKVLLLDDVEDGECLTVQGLAGLLHKQITQDDNVHLSDSSVLNKRLPRVITFPYSRHSSYAELCHLVDAFKPKQVYPCTVEEGRWHDHTVATLFGKHCSGSTFRHDLEMGQAHKNHDSDGSSPISNDRSSTEGSPLASSMLQGLTSPIHDHFTSPSFPSDTAETDEKYTADHSGSASMLLELQDIDDVLQERRTWNIDKSNSVISSDYNHMSVSSSPGHGENSVPTIFWDPNDDVFRCGKCGWEFLGEIGECSSKICDNASTPQSEARRPDISSDEEMGIDLQPPQTEISELLDESPANESDSLTENDEYEESFIDDRSIHSLEDRSPRPIPSEDDRNYEELHRELLIHHRRLERKHQYLALAYEEFKRDILGSDYESDEDLVLCKDSFPNSQPTNDTSDDAPVGVPFVVVDVEVNDPALTAIIENADSQESLLSESRLANRVAGFEAALSSNEGSCNIALISVDDNHTMPELEL